jgi:hypothetical protein
MNIHIWRMGAIGYQQLLCFCIMTAAVNGKVLPNRIEGSEFPDFHVFNLVVVGYRLNIELTSNGPAVLDSNITFTVKLSYPSGIKPTGKYYCKFEDQQGSYEVNI